MVALAGEDASHWMVVRVSEKMHVICFESGLAGSEGPPMPALLIIGKSPCTQGSLEVCHI